MGFVIVLLNFNRRDKIYLDNNFDLINGIKILKAGRVWKYENLIITNVNNETLLVRNKLFWFEKSENRNEKLNESFDTVLTDYKTINKEPKFEKYSRNYKVRIQIYEVLDNATPIIDKEI